MRRYHNLSFNPQLFYFILYYHGSDGVCGQASEQMEKKKQERAQMREEKKHKLILIGKSN